MEIEKVRYFQDTVKNRVFMEKIIWVLMGTGMVEMGDQRCCPIGETRTHPITNQPIDSWLPVTMGNPAFEPQRPTYVTEDAVSQDEEGRSIVIQKPISVENQYSGLNVYLMDLKPNLVEISLSEHNDFISNNPYPW